MSLETVLKLGRLYRQSPNSKDYHELVNKVSRDVDAIKKKKDTNGNLIQTSFYRIPVSQGDDGQMRILLNERELIEDEDRKKNLYYLNFKTSGKDAEKRYLFGDIIYNYFQTKSGADEGGNYRLIGKSSSFLRCEEIAASLADTPIGQFRKSFAGQREEIEALLLSEPSIVLHFDFGGKDWYEFPNIFDTINAKIMESFVSEHKLSGGVVLEKYLYKTLGGTTPGFGSAGTYKTKVFTPDEVQDLMYAVGLSQKPLIRIKSIGIVALPKGENLSFGVVNRFLSRSAQEAESDEDTAENQLKTANQATQDDPDDLFGELIENEFADNVQYDILMMSIPASVTGVYADLVEISSVEKSLLREVSVRINKVRREIIDNALSSSNGRFQPSLLIQKSFRKILGGLTKEEKKYQSHILKILPQIYTNTYFSDSLLLPAFIEKIEKGIRDGEKKQKKEEVNFLTFKYDFYFLMKIQNQDNLMPITESKSYAIGQCLGTMAKQFAAWRDDCPIKSFEKSYVGNLTRRISSLDEVAVFCDFLNQKLTMHERLFSDVTSAYLKLTELLKNFSNERYNKHYCSLGFFESYYTNDTKKTTTTSAEVTIV